MLLYNIPNKLTQGECVMAKKAIVINKKYFQDENALYLFAQWMKEEDGVTRYQWRLYRNDFGYWHSFVEDACWRVDQYQSEKDGLEVLEKEYLKEGWFKVNYIESTMMIAGNIDIIKAKEDIIDLINAHYPELTVRFI